MNELQAAKMGDIAESEFGPTLAKFGGAGGAVSCLWNYEVRTLDELEHMR
jgi:hypothetical protein